MLELAALAFIALVGVAVVASRSASSSSSSPFPTVPAGGLTPAQVDLVTSLETMPAIPAAGGVLNARAIRVFRSDAALGIWRSLASQSVATNTTDPTLATIGPTHDGAPVPSETSAQAYAAQRNIAEGRFVLAPIYMAFDTGKARFLRTPIDPQSVASFAGDGVGYAVLAHPGEVATLIARADGGAVPPALPPAVPPALPPILVDPGLIPPLPGVPGIFQTLGGGGHDLAGAGLVDTGDLRRLPQPQRDQVLALMTKFPEAQTDDALNVLRHAWFDLQSSFPTSAQKIHDYVVAAIGTRPAFTADAVPEPPRGYMLALLAIPRDRLTVEAMFALMHIADTLGKASPAAQAIDQWVNG